jgi:hypothetical protein
MEMQPLMEMKAVQEQMLVKLDARNAELGAHHERMVACLGKTEATELKAKPEENESIAEQQEVPKEDAVVKPVKGWKKRHRGRKLAAE